MIPLEPEASYHIYNRANGDENVFVNPGNYVFFLEKYKKYIAPVADTYCYCLMPNHFHFLIRIRKAREIGENLREAFPKFETLEKLISKQFSNLFSSYSQAFNKQQSRMGSLFMKNFKRKKISDDKYFVNIIHYIHRNPVEASLCNKPEEWTYSSYSSFLSGDNNSLLLKKEVLERFGNLENFMFCHQHE